ncbi:hypothetical protein LAZ67_6001129 [Cordylochernes scorpioides]|uniref:Transposase n=1 Tax=Cordylochernes scorpioides TaxID=51811 RepID=A0ABY6KJP6_9ARAC|nr:hypothetical protein LAZ67_6001129 [Cordylochernes scorpioides]
MGKNFKSIDHVRCGPPPRFPRMCGTSLKTINNIIHKDLELDTRRKGKVHKLTPFHMKNRATNARKLYEEHLAGSRSEYTATLDEAWMYVTYCNGIRKICYIKRGNQVPDNWVHQCSETFPKGFMVVGVMTGRGVLPLIKVPSKVKVNSEFYIECVLKPVIEQLKDLYPGEMDKVFLHHDKASSHTSNKTQQFLQEMKDTLGLNFIRNSDIPVKSPDASPLDFYGFVIVAVYACGVDEEKGPIRQQLWNAPPCDRGTMTAQRYVDDVLRPVTLPYLQGVPNALYQQDNARPHTARISQQALQDVQMLPWPPYSPDLSPIEHVWDIIGRRLHALPQPRSEDELWKMETKLNQNLRFNIKDYTTLRKDRPGKFGGGLAVLIKTLEIKFKEIAYNQSKPRKITTEAQALTDKTIPIINVYHHDNTSINTGLIETLSEASSDIAIILGDVNAERPTWGSPVQDNKGQQVEDMLTDLDLTPLNNEKNTYLSKSTGTESAIDITAINYNIAPTTQWKILKSAISDHRPILTTLKFKIENFKQNKRTLEKKSQKSLKNCATKN